MGDSAEQEQVPAGQGTHLPLVLYQLSAHMMQWIAFDIPVPLWLVVLVVVPLGHAMQASSPVVLPKRPTSQTTHAKPPP